MRKRKALVLIPARMAATRLPGKPLADIAGEPMIVHVMRRAAAAKAGPVAVATDSEAIAACVEKAGGRAVMTSAAHASGSDRICEALARFVALPPSRLERRERLEQLRALEAGMRIDVAIVEGVPLGVDTPEDLARARELLGRGR